MTQPKAPRKPDPDITRMWKLKRLAAKVHAITEQANALVAEAPENQRRYLLSVYEDAISGILLSKGEL